MDNDNEKFSTPLFVHHWPTVLVGALTGVGVALATDAETLFTFVPMSWGWLITELLAGSRAADAQWWVPLCVTGACHGALLMGLRIAVAALTSRMKVVSPMSAWTLAIAIAIHVALLFIPAGPE
jgi:hypothetical protein